MNSFPRDLGFENRLRSALGEAPRPDFDAWRSRHSDSLSALGTTPAVHVRPFVKPTLLAAKWIAAAAAIIVCFFVFRSDGTAVPKALAGPLPGVDAPETLAWTTTYFGRVTSKDGKRNWLKRERRLNAFRRPGLYRETFLDDSGQPRSVEITDVRAGRTLRLDLKNKRAVLMRIRGMSDLRGPFVWVGEAIRDRIVAKTLRVESLALLGLRILDQKPANLIRAMIEKGDNQGTLRHDFYFEPRTRRLVGIWIANEKDCDLEPALESTSPAETEYSKWLPYGYLEHELVLDAKLNPDDFSLEPPPGFAFENPAAPSVSEPEMLDFLAAAAAFNGGVFRDAPFAAFDQAKFNAAAEKPATEQTRVERELILLHDRFLNRGIRESPILRFVEDHVEPGTFHYVGSGTKVGDAQRIVCWYKPKGAAQYRAVFGNLAVRDLKESDLPIEIDINQ